MFKSHRNAFMSDVAGFIFRSISAEPLHFHSEHKSTVLGFFSAVKRLPNFHCDILLKKHRVIRGVSDNR